MQNTLPQWLPFWPTLTSEQQEGLYQHTQLNHYPAQAIVHSGHQDCAGIMLVKEGCLRVFMLSKEGREITLFYIKAGEVCVLSASCVMNSLTFPIQIEAEVDSHVFNIQTHFFQKLAAQNLYVENYMYKAAMTRFSEVMWVMDKVLFASLDKRIATFLLMEAQEDQLSVTHEQIAKHIGSAREVVSRMLKYFEQEGWVSLKRGWIQIDDPQALSELR